MRHLANTHLQLILTFYIWKVTNQKQPRSEHMDICKTFSEIKDEYFDGWIITGAPEHLSFISGLLGVNYPSD